jgi:uncharacterized protein (TIGR00369 family)
LAEIAGDVGVRIISADRQRVVGEFIADRRHLDAQGRLRACALMALADDLGGHGATLCLPGKAEVASLEAKINVFQPCGPGRVTAEATRLHMGGGTLVWQTSVQGPEGEAVAVVLQTQIVVPGQSAPAIDVPSPEIVVDANAPTRIARQRRDQIFEAACHVFAEKGFAKATVKEIAEAAGLHVPTMYQYVRSKDELLAMIFVGSFERIETEVAASIDGAAGAREKLCRALAATLDCYDRYKTQIRLISRETKALPPDVRARVLRGRAAFVDLFSRIVADGIAAGEFKGDLDPELVANIAVTMCEVWPLRRFAVSRFGLARVEEEILAILLRGVATGDMTSPMDGEALDKEANAT